MNAEDAVEFSMKHSCGAKIIGGLLGLEDLDLNRLTGRQAVLPLCP